MSQDDSNSTLAEQQIERWLKPPRDYVDQRSHRGSQGADGANKIVWGVAGALGLAGLTLFSWNLYATFQVSKDIVSIGGEMKLGLANVNLEIVKVNAKLDMGARDIDELKRARDDMNARMANLEKRP